MEVAQRKGSTIVSIFLKQNCITLLSTNALLMCVRARARENEAPAIKEEMIKMGEYGYTYLAIGRLTVCSLSSGISFKG